jgi:GAF domain-containing protein
VSGKTVKERRHEAATPKRALSSKAVPTRRAATASQNTEIERLTRELKEARELQAATSNILRIISQSPTDARPIFDGIVVTATRLLRSDHVAVMLRDGDTFSAVAAATPEGLIADARLARNVRIDPSTNFPSRAIIDGKMLHLPDWSLIDVPKFERKVQREFGVKSALYLPLLHDGVCIGLLTLVAKRPHSFGPAEIAQAESFRDQAVIAIENTRLLNELRQSLQQQTATADVLKVISRSTFELQTVLNTLVESAARLCDADSAAIYRPAEGGVYRHQATYGYSSEFIDYMRLHPLTPNRGSVIGQVALEHRAVHIEDVLADPNYQLKEQRTIGGYRTALGVPLMRDGSSIGVIVLSRSVVKAFTDKQIELVTTFADQAAIAIENTRLFEAEQQRTRELSESLEQQMATSDVLRVISSSPAELEPVFQAMLENAVRICEAKFGTLIRFDGSAFHYAAQVGAPPAYAEFQMRRGPFQPTTGALLDRVMQTKQVIHTADEMSEAAPGPSAKFGGARSNVCVPMLKDNELIGAILIYRQEVRPFTDKQIELVQNFAAQAVIAIENTRLLNELRESLQQQTATAEVLHVISSSLGELEPVFQAMLENATRICEAKFGTLYLREGDGIRLVGAYNIPPAFAEARGRGLVYPSAEGSLGQVLRTKQTAHVADVAATTAYLQRHPFTVQAVEVGGVRTTVSVPLLKDNELVGIIAIYRQEVRPFTDRQVALLTNFAAQAVIAIENARLLSELRQRTDDLTESLEQQTATSEVLRVVSSSPGDLQPVFHAMLESAVHICEAKFGVIHRFDGTAFHFTAEIGTPSELVEFNKQRSPFQPPPSGPLDEVMRTKQVYNTIDDAAEAVPGPAVRLGGARSLIAVPMLKDSVLIGAIVIYRQEVRPFTDKQIALVQNFAAQAVIAIENTRLLNELRESLQQQTATADVLKIISRSTFDLKAVLRTLVESAAHVCEADISNIALPSADGFYQIKADYGQPAALSEELMRQRFKPGPGGVISRTALSRSTVHILDAQTDPDYQLREAQRLGGYHTLLGVPLLREGNVVGVFGVGRTTVYPFTEKQIELVTTFADQAVIAIENARLLSELRESLEQQTGTSEILRVISSSPTDVQPVLDTIVRTAVNLCNSYDAVILLREDGQLRIAAHHGPMALDFERLPLGRDFVSGRTVIDGVPVHVPDFMAAGTEFPRGREVAKRLKQRTVLGLPLKLEGETVGCLFLRRTEVLPFTDKQIELLATFADQAVIAIENVRLFDAEQQRTRELSESLEQQTATSEVLQVISSSLGDLEPVFQAMLQKATRICDAKFGTLNLRDGDGLRLVAAYNVPPAFAEARRGGTVYPAPETSLGQVLRTKQTAHVANVAATQAYHQRHPATVQAVDLGGVRTAVSVPLVKDNELVGIIAIYRQEVRPFTDKQVALLTSFAAQAVIAIENTRLLNELRQRTDDLSKSLEDLRTAQDRLVQTQKLASLGQLTAGIAHEIKNPLNFVNNFSGVSVELIDELQETLGRVTADKKTREEIAELADTLRENLDKIVQHGQRADSIVKNMLLHSREGSGERRSVDVNALVEESLNLAYHGARAEKQGFNVTMERSFDPSAGEVDAFPQEITRVLLNLIANGFYAATKRQGQESSNGFEPTITAATKSLGDRVEIRIRDNGIGIPPEVREKMFNPFFTTKPAGEGTGLGLSISHDIIVKQHAGSIEVDTEPGTFTEFRIILPRTAS